MHLEHGEHMQKLREMKDEIRNQIKVMHGETEKKLKGILFHLYRSDIR